jgi:PPK2 family polyphosphate:nucleotide phosphotransferase
VGGEPGDRPDVAGHLGASPGRIEDAMIAPELIDRFRVPPGETVRLKDYPTGWEQSKDLKEHGKGVVKERAGEVLEEGRRELAKAQELLYADGRQAVLIILQAMDAAGKDSTIKHVMSGVNPQGCQVHSFKAPSSEELRQTFLWRATVRLPARGMIGVFNRSYYEEVLVVKVHPEILEHQGLPPGKRGKKFWLRRYDDINAFERHLDRNGTRIVKFFLHISKDEQKKRFLERLDRPEKHWKFSAADLAERARWDDYMDAYADALSATSTKRAPWYIVPADDKWATRAIVAGILTTTIRGLDLHYPEVTEAQEAALAESRKRLEAE